VLVDSSGTEVSRQLFRAFGAPRYTSGTDLTDYGYTGQRADDSIGLMYYNARWYDPALGRFTQADTIIPGAGNPLAWDRYAYVINNPVNYSDSSGNLPLVDDIGVFIGQLIYAFIVRVNPDLNREVRDEIGGTYVENLTEVVNAQSNLHGISPDLVNGIIRHESGAFERRVTSPYSDFAELCEAMIRSGGTASIGIGQMQVRRAEELESLGYVYDRNGWYFTVISLLDPEQAVQYIAGMIDYITDQLTSTYGTDFSQLPEEDQSRLILIAYNEGWESVANNMSSIGVSGVIGASNYDDYTYDDYYLWKNRSRIE